VQEGFGPLLEATSNLRKEQEEEGRLQERMQEQRVALGAAERRYTEVNRRLAETRASNREDISAEELLEGTRREALESRDLVQKLLPNSIEARKETLSKLERVLREGARSEEELYALRSEVAAMEDIVARLTQEVAAQQRAAGDDKLASFRQQAAVVSKKLVQREEMLEVATREAEALAREVEAKEAKLSEIAGPRYMRKEDFKVYAANLRAKTMVFKNLKQELSEIRQETVVLARTETLLKGRAGDWDEFLRRLEEKKGVSGYATVQSDIEKLSALKAQIDESKGKTLNEISKIVNDINSAIKEKKARLDPAIKQLRAMRQKVQDFEAIYLREKATYDNVAAGFEVETSTLEREADVMQEDALREEGRYHLLQTQVETAQALLDRARDEAAFERGETRYLRDFKTMKELLTSKLGQLEVQAKELRKRQKDMKENATVHAAQRTRFVDLKKLVQTKITGYKNGGADGATGKAEFEETGGANVMTLGYE
jgi:intraflagellar transport protein 81